jgi:RNA polymerase sigma-70 factor (ECF subfamily)
LNNDALEDIYGKYSRELYLYVFSMCRDHHGTEDIVSDTFFKAIASIDVMEGHMKYWLFRVARNQWIDRLRKDSKLSCTGYDEGFDGKWEDRESRNPAEDLINSEEKRMLYRAIVELLPQYKEAITLYYFCGYPLKEIAKVLGITPGAARTLLYRARNKLKEELKDVMIDG